MTALTQLASPGLAAAAGTLAETGRTTAGEALLFWCLAPIMVLSALGLVFARRAVYAAMSVVVVMVSLAILYVAQEAPFLGVVQVIVYTGAVMMLFLFVLMLVGVDASDSLVETIKGQRWIGWLFGLGLGGVLIGVVLTASGIAPQGLEAANADTNPVGLARIIFGDYVFALEVVGVLLITAAVGALVFTHRERLTRKIGQKERADSRVAAGTSLVPLPAPGVYARSNAMDVPALDAQGRPIDASVSRVLRVRGQEREVGDLAADNSAGDDARHLDADDTGPGTTGGVGSTPPQRSITGEETVR